jgi:hypothetical protein
VKTALREHVARAGDDLGAPIVGPHVRASGGFRN